MIVVNLKGGLGNQMFQYAFGRRLSLLLGWELVLNNDVYEQRRSNRPYALDIFELPAHRLLSAPATAGYLEKNRKPVFHLQERHFHYDDELMGEIWRLYQSSRMTEFHLVVSGYWQSYRYIEGIADTLHQDFVFRNPLRGQWCQLGQQISGHEAVMVNVRRGDYLQKLRHHGVVGKDYLLNAIERMRDECVEPCFYVFSDDIPWCRKHLGHVQRVSFVDESYYDEKYQYYLQLMVKCRHFIIANSSFAWWAAWLNTSKRKKVIAPRRWFNYEGHDTNSLSPGNWVQI